MTTQQEFNNMIADHADKRRDEVDAIFDRLTDYCEGSENVVSFLAAVELVAAIIESSPKEFQQNLALAAITAIGNATGGEVRIAEEETAQ